MTSLDARDETKRGASLPAPRAPELRIGTTIGAYRIEAIAGRGGMGVVYRAEHLHLGRPAALKLLLPELADDEGFRERFLRESRVAAAITHPNVIPVYDAGEADGLLYIAMKYIDGTDLGALLRREGALEPERALFLLGQVAEALDAAHAMGIVHRDVKPGNVLIDSGRCYLTDFGLTRRISPERGLTVKGEFVGTVDYMAPEQIKGGAVDARTDVYALGCLLYHALAGTAPYERDSEVSVVYAHLEDRPPALATKRPGLTRELDGVITTALAKQKQDRFDTCGDLIAAARTALGFAPPTSAGAPPAQARRRKALIADPAASVRALISVSLDPQRFEVLEAEDSERALAVARAEGPELVFADWSLPGAAGGELCEALRTHPETAGATVIAMTARSDGIDERAVLAAGANGHLRKPFSSLQLLLEVGALLPEASPR
jgi:serine/threonine-protein kinase